jgi:hypothetical protein
VPTWTEVIDPWENPRSLNPEYIEPDISKRPEQPVLRVITKVFGNRNRPRAPRGRRVRNNGGRPITATFHNYNVRGEPEYYSSDEEQEQTEDWTKTEPLIQICSKHLINAIRAVVAYYPYFSTSGDILTIPSPYRVLYHHREDLSLYRFNQPEEHTSEYAATTAEHIDILLKFLDQSNNSAIRKEEERHRLEEPMATYELFWLLLKPGSIIYAKRYDIWTPFVISSVRGGNSSFRPSDQYSIDCWMLESNGAKVGRFMQGFNVPPWLGEQAISTLPVVPAAFWKEDLNAQGGLPMHDRQVQLGKMYWELLKKPTYMDYDGMLVDSGATSRNVSGPTGFMSGRVICDVSGFDKYYERSNDYNFVGRDYPPREVAPLPPHKDHLPKTRPHCCCEVCLENRPAKTTNNTEYSGFEDIDPVKDEAPESDLFYLVLGSTMPGFILGSRRWGHLNIANLHPVKTDKEAFRYLVLDEEIKLTVRALIGKFANNALDGGATVSPWGQDIVRNKGEGRIFLLHGQPGVGKTCTAECIAELANRPLISLTSGDLSIENHRVEANLSYFLELGQRYGALVLLDEADVYLERRHSSDISRNGLVSIFLRALEYYRGVLFLTTNRVQSFDSAFLSRIHVALHYKNLRDEDRERIWANNFDRLDRESQPEAAVGGDSQDDANSVQSVHVSVSARDYVRTSREVRALRWNGREIRNAMQTALALAESDAHDEGESRVVIGEKHIRAVVKMSQGFRDYVKASRYPVIPGPRYGLSHTFDGNANHYDADHKYDSDAIDTLY